MSQRLKSSGPGKIPSAAASGRVPPTNVPTIRMNCSTPGGPTRSSAWPATLVVQSLTPVTPDVSICRCLLTGFRAIPYLSGPDPPDPDPDTEKVDTLKDGIVGVHVFRPRFSLCQFCAGYLRQLAASYRLASVRPRSGPDPPDTRGARLSHLIFLLLCFWRRVSISALQVSRRFLPACAVRRW